MICDHWPPEFRALYGGTFPRTFLSIDIETTGFSRANDLIIEFGLCEVEDGAVVRRQNCVLDWSRDPTVTEADLRNKLTRIDKIMWENQRSWRMNYDLMQAEGKDARETLEFMHDYITTMQDNGFLLVGHNGYAFDEGMLAANFSRFLGVDGFSFGDNGMLDTGAIVKASQCPVEAKWLPRVGDTLRSYSSRITHSVASGVPWNLDTYCMKAYGLHKKLGAEKAQCHTAGFDAYLVALLMAELAAAEGRVASAVVDNPEFLSVADYARAVEARRRRFAPAPELKGRTQRRF